MAVGTQPGDFVQFDVGSPEARGTRGQTQRVVYLYSITVGNSIKLFINFQYLKKCYQLYLCHIFQNTLGYIMTAVL